RRRQHRRNKPWSKARFCPAGVVPVGNRRSNVVMRSFPVLVAAAWFACSVQAVALDFADPDGDRRARNQFAIGVDLLQHGKYEEATPYLENALEKFPDNISILKDLAFI